MSARRLRTALRVALQVVVCGVALAQGWPAVAQIPGAEIEIGFMNGVYDDLDSNFAPIHQGSITIQVSSPEHRVTVHGNRLQLTPNAAGSIDAAMEVDFEGGGRLVADVESIGRFVDDVQAPRQTVRAAGRVRLERAEDGYRFTVVDADPFVELEIQSGVAGQVVGACRALSLIPFVSLPCDGLETALATVNIPLPKAGEQFVVPAAELGEAETAFLDRFVAKPATTDAR